MNGVSTLKGGRWRPFFHRLGVTVLDAIFPAACLHCGLLFQVPRLRTARTATADLACRFRALMKTYLCPLCSGRFEAVASPMCVHCGEPVASPHALDHLCGACQDRPPRFSAARAAGCYQGPLRALIHQHKYAGRECLGQPLGRLLWDVLIASWDPIGIDRIVSVPLHPARMRQRGFNQAHALIRGWPRLARRKGFSIGNNWVEGRILKRRRPTRPQIGLHKDQRAANLAEAFETVPGSCLQGQRIVLVDDVLTTGATADACAGALLAAGAADVRVLTLARAV